MGNSPANTKVREEGGREGALGTGAEIPLQPPERTMMKQIFSLGRILHWSGCTCPEGSCSLWKDPVEAAEQHEEEGAEERSCYGLSITPISHCPAPQCRTKFGVRSEGIKLMLAGKRDGRNVF